MKSSPPAYATVTAHLRDRFPEHPIFRKDLILLGKALLSILALQVFLIMAFQLIIYFTSGRMLPLLNMAGAFGNIQLVFSPLFALAAAGYCFAEEKAQGTDIFLRRLPISRKRVCGEKLAAGFTSLAALFIFQWLFHLISTIFSVPIWAEGEGVGFVILAITLVSYLVGLPISFYVKQTLAVILLGAGLQLVVSTLVVTVARGTNYRTSTLFWIVLLAVIPILFGLFSERLRGGRWLSHTRMARTPFGALIWKSVRENIVVYLLAALATAICILPTPDSWIMGVSIAAGVILAVLGINTYSPLEKEGTLCMLYHHPIPRKNVFLAKVAPNLLCALALSAALAFSIQLASSQSHYRTHLIEYVFEYGAPDVLPSLTVLTLICGVILSLVFRRPHYVLVTGAFAALLFFCYNMQVPDGRAHGYLPFTPLALGGLMFYACGVLMTLSFKRPIYALITTGGAISFAYIVIVYLIEPAAWLGGQLRNRHAYPSESLKDGLGPILLWPSLILFVGLLASAWRTATDRAALTGTEYIRPLYGIRLFGFTLAITVVLTTTGWGDLFYLLTKLDLGLG